MITVGFKFVDEFGNEHTAESKVDVFNDLGETDLDVIGRQLNAFLAQVGYIRHKDMLFMEDIDEDEYDMLSYALEDYRSGNACEQTEMCCDDCECHAVDKNELEIPGWSEAE